MTLSLQQLFILFVSLFTLFSPLACIGPIASLAGHFSRSDQKKLAFAVFVNAVLVLVAFVWVGNFLFELLGVNSYSLSVTGGIALMIAGLPMMLGSTKPDKDEPAKQTQNWRDMAVVPMTFPMSIGGTTAAYVVSATGEAEGVLDLAAISGVVVLFTVVIWLTHLFSPPLAAKLKPRSRVVLNRVGGIVLVAIAVQLLASGLKGLFPVLA